MFESEDLFRTFIELANRHDVDGIQRLLADDLIYISPMMGPDQRDKNGMRNFQAGLFEGFPNLAYHIESLHSKAGLVMAECTVRGTHTGDLFGYMGIGNEPFNLQNCLGNFCHRDLRI